MVILITSQFTPHLCLESMHDGNESIRQYQANYKADYILHAEDPPNWKEICTPELTLEGTLWALMQVHLSCRGQE